MPCKTYHRAMTGIHYIEDDGTGHSVHEYRCVGCWKHATVREPRKKVTG